MMMGCNCCQRSSQEGQNIPGKSNGQSSSPSSTSPPPSAVTPPTAQTIPRGRQDAAMKDTNGDAAAVGSGMHGKGGVHDHKQGETNNGYREGKDEDESDDAALESLFFDALQSFSDAVSSMSYPPTSSMIQGARVSLFHPETLLSQPDLVKGAGTDAMIDENDRICGSTSIPSVGTGNGTGSVLIVSRHLQEAKAGGVRHGQGYPGELNAEEMARCLKFREELKKRDPAYREIVTCYGPVEQEAFALCRFLRAAQFDVDELFRMFDENGVVEIWKEGRRHQFYSDFEKVFHCPWQVFDTQFPMLISGLAKNGATVNYFKAGDINIDGVECVADLPSLSPFVWHILYKRTKMRMERLAAEIDPTTTTVLAEKVIIVDLKGMPAGLFSPRGMEFIKGAAKVTRCFPEILNRMYLVNVPTSFSMFWGILKMFMKPRTIQKIGFFANASKAKEDLLHYVDSDQLLSDYGGTGPSFYEEFGIRQTEQGTYSRYIVELMTVSRKGCEFSFAIDGKETIASIVIYSKSDQGAEFSLKNKSNSAILIQPTFVSRKTAGVTRTHYSVSLMTGESNIPAGPGNFAIQAKGTKEKGNFLVALSLKDDGV
jgi:hypothetical protein